MENDSKNVLSKIESLKAEIQKLRNGVLDEVRATVQQHQFTAFEIFGSEGKGVARTRAPVKFKHPKTGQTWSGRGRTPVWLSDEIASGKQVEDFLVS